MATQSGKRAKSKISPAKPAGMRVSPAKLAGSRVSPAKLTGSRVSPAKVAGSRVPPANPSEGRKTQSKQSSTSSKAVTPNVANKNVPFKRGFFASLAPKGMMRRVKTPRKPSRKGRFADPAKTGIKQMPLSMLEEDFERDSDVIKEAEEYTPIVAPENYSWSLLDAGIMCGLLISSETLLSFPLHALKHGGYFFLAIYFLFAYLISFPLLHFELFTSQYTQCGILKALEIYGKAYKGIGFGIILLTVLNQHVMLHNGYYVLSHTMSLPGNIMDVVDCNSTYYTHMEHCESLYNDRQCIVSGKGKFFVEGQCEKSKETSKLSEKLENAAAHSTGIFMKSLDESADYPVIIFLYALLFFCSCLGVKGLRCLCFATFILVSTYAVLIIVNLREEFEGIFALLAALSNPSALFRIETYLVAFRVTILSYGHCTFGLFCASSFRHRNARSLQTTRVIFWWIMAVSVLVLLRTVSMIHHVNGYGRHTTSSIRIARSGIVFELSAEMEYLALTTDSPKLFLVTHHLLCLIVNLSSAFGAIFVIYAVMRDYFPNLGHGKGCIVLLVYAVSSLTYYVLGSLNLADREVAFEASVISFSKYFFLCLMVIVFIQAYGDHEFEIDVISTLGEKSGLMSIFNATSMFPLYRIALIILAGMQAVECNRELDWLHFYELYEDSPKAPTRKREDSYLISIIYLLPPIVPLVFFGKKFATARKDMAIADLFNIGEGHPSYTRVKGKPATQDMIGDQLLDKTPPESDTTPAASAKKNQAGKPDSKEPIIEEQPTLASEKETAPPTSASTLQVRSVAPQTNAPPAVAPRKKQSLLVAETMGDDV